MNHRRLYVGDLASGVTERDLRDLFAQIGNVESINLHHATPERRQGFAFIEMTDPEDARLAVQTLNGRDLFGSRLIVYTVPPRSRPRSATVRP